MKITYRRCTGHPRRGHAGLKPGPSKWKRSFSFTTKLGRDGTVRFPRGVMSWKPGTRLYWVCKQFPYSAVYASPYPLGCLHKGRYLSSKVKSLGYSNPVSARGVFQRPVSPHGMRLQRQIANHRQRIHQRQLVQRRTS